MMNQLLFIFLSFLTLVSALTVVFTKNPMYSVLSLIFCFFTIAGHYILLHAQFLAIVHLIVYAGAIMVLFLFVVMLLNLNAETEPHKPNKIRIAAVISSGILLLTLIAAMKTGTIGAYQSATNTTMGQVQNIGQRLFTDFLLPFEISSILFLSAMIGAVLLAKKNNPK